MTKATKFHIGYWIAAFIGVLLVQCVYGTTQQVANIPYSQFEQLLHEGLTSASPIGSFRVSSRNRSRARASS